MARATAFRHLTAAALVAAALTWAGASPVDAKEGPGYARSKTAKMTRKFWRGVGNVCFGWAEIPRSVFRKCYDTDVCSGVIFGFGEGTKLALKRMGVGAWEAATFYSPGHRDYQPYIQPEFPLMDDQD
ncbi:MAG: exosortase system-associated protein, TIGR04073 family [Candidatus Sumerlaeota bacterium]|nr:exosortase system-associated protein, TIGR04073 family [Candidatus Sumerlaeota bacterium]